MKGLILFSASVVLAVLVTVRARPEVKVISANPKHYEKNPLARAQHDISDLEKLQHIKEWKEREKKTWDSRISSSWLRSLVIPEPKQAQFPECPGPVEFNSDSGVLVSPNFPNKKYKNNLDCSWRITTAPGTHIKLTTSFFNVETDYSGETDSCDNGCTCPYDYVDVIEGSNVNAAPTDHLCGDVGPDGTYETNVLTIHFVSDSSVRRWGFEIAFEEVQASGGGGGISPACLDSSRPEVLNGETGSLSSPVDAETGYYPNHANCAWRIVVPEGKVVKLEFSLFDVEAEPSCNYDAMVIYDAGNDNTTPMAMFCGTGTVPAQNSTGNKMFVVFTSDYSVTKNGFQATFTAVDANTNPPTSPPTTAPTTTPTTPPTTPQASGGACSDSGRPEHLSGSGTITSPVSGSTYPDFADCGWVITASSGQAVNLHFIRFAVENSQGCIYDAVKVYEGNSPSGNPIAVLCGSAIPNDVTSAGSQVYVQFKSDFSVNMAGFAIAFSSVAVTTPPTTTPATTTTGSSGGGGGSTGGFRCGVAPVQTAARIVGGTESPENRWPWQISLRYWNGHICGGTIINKRWVITAAHCVSSDASSITPASYLSIIAGAHRQDYNYAETGRQIIDVAEVISHSEYYENGQDIALLRLSADLEWTDYVHPACLPTSAVADGADCWITGWGATENTGSNSVLRQAEVPIVSQSTCTSNLYYGSYVNQFMVCAGFQDGGVDTCQGDSGGPLVCPASDGAYVLHGVTSWGSGCADPYKPGVYARVSALMNWVDQYTSGDYYTD